MIEPRALLELFNSQEQAISPRHSEFVSDFVSQPKLLADRAYHYALELGQVKSETSIAWRALRSLAKNFHEEAGTYTDEVKQICDFSDEGIPIIRLAHQPNIFPYLGVIVQFFLMDNVAVSIEKRHRTKVAQIYLIVNYDVAEDVRFRTAHYPDANRKDGVLDLSSKIPGEFFHKPMFAVPKPSEPLVVSWFQSIRSAISQELVFLRRAGLREKKTNILYERLQMLEELTWSAHSRATSFADFNSYFLSQVINSGFGLPTLFVRGNELQALYKNSYEFFINNLRRLREAENQAIEAIASAGISLKYQKHELRFPIWYFCDMCSSRVTMTYATESKVWGECTDCGRNYEFNLDNPSGLLAHLASLAPSVLIDDISDALGLRACGGVSYVGGAEHILVSNIVCRMLGIKMFPQIVWRPRTAVLGTAEFVACLRLQTARSPDKPALLNLLTELSKGRISVLYNLVSSDLSGFAYSWQRFFGECHSVGDTHFDRTLCPLNVQEKHLKSLQELLKEVIFPVDLSHDKIRPEERDK